MAQHQRYKRSELIDEDKEAQLIHPNIRWALENKADGWKTDKINPSVQIKCHPITRRPIYRYTVENISKITMKQMYDYWECGYEIDTKQEDANIHRRILHNIDCDHSIMYASFQSKFTATRDYQYVSTRFKKDAYKSLSGQKYNVIGLATYSLPKTHPLFMKSPKNVIRIKHECDAEICYQTVGAQPNEFVYVKIYCTIQSKGWIPKVIENAVQSNFIKTRKGKLDMLCDEIPNVLEQRKNKNQRKSILMNKEQPMYLKLVSMGIKHERAMVAANLFPNDFEFAKLAALNNGKDDCKEKENEMIDDIMNIQPEINETNRGLDDFKAEELGNKKIDEALSSIESVKMQFLNFLKRTNMEMYYDKFEVNGCWNIKDIEFFDDEYLDKTMGIKNSIIRKRFLKQCRRFKVDMEEFQNECGINKVLYERLAKYGLVTLSILCNAVQSKDDLKEKYKITNESQLELLWNLVQETENGISDQTEGAGQTSATTTGYTDIIVGAASFQ